MLRKRWRHTWSCRNRYMWYVISVPVHQIHSEWAFTLEIIKRTRNDRYFAIWLWKHTIWCHTATQFSTCTKRQFSPLWQPVPNDVSIDEEQSIKTIILHSVVNADIKVRNYLAPNFTTGDFRIRVRGPPANYVYGRRMTLVKRGSLGYASHQKGVIQGHLVHRYASRRAPALCSMIMFRTVLSLDVSTQTVSLDYVRKIYLAGYFWCFVVSI